MARYTVTHTCGHDQDHQLWGPHRERDRKLDWLGTTLCSDCYREEQEKKRQAENEAAAAANAGLGLPALEGSEKQIAWAESIRRPVCEVLREVERMPLDAAFSEAARRELQDAIVLVCSEIVEQTAARWWIDERDELSIDFGGSAAGALDEVLQRVHERGLAPLAKEEAARIVETKRREKQERIARTKAVIDGLVRAIEEDRAEWQVDPQSATVTADGHTASYSIQRGLSVEIDGQGVGGWSVDRLRGLLQERRNAKLREQQDREMREAAESLAGRSVADVRKDKQDLTVTLDDGRTLHGKSSRSGWALTGIRRDRCSVTALPAGHPEAVRLAAEAKAHREAARKAAKGGA